MAAWIETEARGEKFLLHGARLLSWPSEKMLMVADMHLGKAQTFQRHGLWLPPEANAHDLALLAKTARAHALERIVFLGDFVHARAGVTPGIVEQLIEWRSAFAGKVTVIVGNHDRPVLKHWPARWDFVELVEELRIRDFTLTHEPPPKPDGRFTWCGHLHPKVSLKRGADSLYLPAFVLTPDVGYVPAFSSLAGGAEFPLQKGNRYYVTTGEEVLEISAERTPAVLAPRAARAGKPSDGSPADAGDAEERP
jgi:DNA ligase-associated metallophosphoesterase